MITRVVLGGLPAPGAITPAQLDCDGRTGRSTGRDLLVLEVKH